MIPELLTGMLVLLFGVSHSFLATSYVKNIVPLSQKNFRLLYVIIGAISLLIVEYFIGILANDPNRLEYESIINPSAEILTIVSYLSIIGVFIIAGSLLQSHPLKFIGLTSENYEKDLETSYFYKFSRHPMYFGALVMFVPILFITNNLVLFTKYFGYSLYFILGAILEENRMSRIFPNYDIMRSRGFLFPWKLSHLQILLLIKNN
ncbi:MAG: hypothetical protein HeimC3_13280 [Candidatus Heimdallarchaeota archaeon LC_3]|nr:MAG: hypothetical protein HeimC3_13280 [Candidatus Heimdallarchaeota archaeon LC_3]